MTVCKTSFREVNVNSIQRRTSKESCLWREWVPYYIRCFSRDRTIICGNANVRCGLHCLFSDIRLQQETHILWGFFRQCLLNAVCCDSVLPVLLHPTTPPCCWHLFISYKALMESNSEEVRLHSEEMSKLKWGWDWTQPGSQLHLAACAKSY